MSGVTSWEERTRKVLDGKSGLFGFRNWFNRAMLHYDIDAVFGPEYGHRMYRLLEEDTQEAEEYAINLARALDQNSEQLARSVELFQEDWGYGLRKV